MALLKMDETIDTLVKFSSTIVAVIVIKDVALNDREARLHDAVTRYWGGLAKRISERSPHGPYDLDDLVWIAYVAVLS